MPFTRADAPHCLSFGRFTFDTSSHTLTRDGVPLDLSATSVAILSNLLARPGEIVSYRDLAGSAHREGASAAPAVVRTAMRQLRQALGDPADYPVFILTIRGTGYRFIAPVALATQSSSTARQNGATPGPRGEDQHAGARGLAGPDQNQEPLCSHGAPPPNLIRWLDDDQSSVDFAVLWCVAATPATVLLLGWSWAPLVLVPPLLRMAYRWLAFRRVMGDGVDRQQLTLAMQWADMRSEVAEFHGAWRTGVQSIARGAFWIALGTACVTQLSVALHPWEWSRMMQQYWENGFRSAIGLIASCIAVILVEAAINPRPVLNGTRRSCRSAWRRLLSRVSARTAIPVGPPRHSAA